MNTNIVSNLDDVRQRVDAEGGVSTFQMGTLRDAVKAGRLGVHVRARISKELQGRGLGHFPPDLPDNQWTTVRVYKLGSQVADLIEAALSPGREQDERLRAATSGDAQEVLTRIKELVC